MHRKKLWFQCLSFFMTIVMIVSCIPLQVLAQEAIAEDPVTEAAEPSVMMQEDMLPTETGEAERESADGSADVPAEVLPEETVPKEVPFEEMVPEEVPSEETTPEELPSEETVPEEVPPEETVPEEVPTEKIVSEESSPEEPETVSEDVASEEPEAGGLLFPEHVTLYYLADSYLEYLSIPEDFTTEYDFTSLSEQTLTARVISGESVTVIDSGRIVPACETYYWYSSGSFSYGTTSPIEGEECLGITREYEEGDSVVRISSATASYEITFTVESYANFYARGVMQEYLDRNIHQDMSLYEKLEVICQFAASYDYSVSKSSATGMIITGGGDCWASTDACVTMCRMLGLEAHARNANRDPNAGSGHVNALVIAEEGEYYVLEAGYYDIAPRPYSVTKRTSLFCYREYEDGIGIYQYDGDLTGKEEFTIPSQIDGQTVLRIEEKCFEGADIQKINLPETLQVIEDKAFSLCSDLQEITIPASVTEIGELVFAGCDVLTDLKAEEGGSFRAENGVLYTADKTAVVAAPAVVEITLPDTVTRICPYAFAYNEKVEWIILPESLTYVGVGAFGDCKKLRMVEFRGDAPEISSYAFHNTKATVYYPENNGTWTDSVMQSHGSGITWESYSGQAAHAHVYAEAVTEATCEAQGYTTYTCDCGKTYVDDYVEPLGHSFGQWYATKEASCIFTGTEKRECGNCGKTETRKIEAQGHSYSGDTDPTCNVCHNYRIVDASQAPFTETEWQMLRELNIRRDQEGLDPVTGNALLQQAAHIRAMEVDDFYSHDRPSGESCFTVIDEIAFPCFAAGENIAWGYGSAWSVTEGWMDSPGHRSNMLRASNVHVAVGECRNSWVQMFTYGEPHHSLSVVVPENLRRKAGMRIEEMDLVAVLEAQDCGECYLPVLGSYCTGYDPDSYDAQTVTISIYDLSTTVTIPAVEEEKCGRNIIWSFDSDAGTLTLSGTGEMYDFSPVYTDYYEYYFDSPWYTLSNKIRTVVIQDGITGIGEFAFAGCNALTQISIPDSLAVIGAYAFCECPALKELVLPDTVVRLEEGCFSSCTGLKTVTLPSTLQTVGLYSFAGCSALKNVVIPGSVLVIEEGAFCECTALKSVTLPDGLKTLGNNAFADCSALESIVLPDSLTTLGEEAFALCTALKSITIPSSLTALSYGVFYETGIREIVIPENIKYISGYALGWCEALEKVTFLGSAPEMEYYAFFHSDILAFYPTGDPTWETVVQDDHEGFVTWVPYGDVPELQIRGQDGLSYILSGKKLELQALLGEAVQSNVVWELLEGGEYASVSSTGKVSAKTVTQPQTVLVQGLSVYSGAVGRLELTILPKGTKLELLAEDQILTDGWNIDIRQQPELLLTAQLNGEPVAVTWTAKNAQIVDNRVCFQNIGTATVTAKDVYGISGTVKLNVFYLDPAKKLKADAQIPAFGLQYGQSVQMNVFGTELLDPGELVFASHAEQIATVDAAGVITAGNQTGTAKITAAIPKDPLNRSVTLTVKVIPLQVADITLLQEEEPVEELVFDLEELRDPAACTFRLDLLAQNWMGIQVPMTDKTVKWTCSNSQLAQLRTNGDGSAVITIKPDAYGTARITAQAADQAKCSATLTLTVMNRAPRLERSSLTLNPMEEKGTNVVLVSSYGNEITAISLDRKDMELTYKDGVLTLNALEKIKNTTIHGTLTVSCQDGKDYVYPLKITVKNQAPAVTVKQQQKLDLFYSDSETELAVTAKGAPVDWSRTMLTDTEDFLLDAGVLCFSQKLIDGFGADPQYKPDTKAKLLVYLEGYTYPLEKSITIGTKTTKLTLSTDPAESVINRNLSEENGAVFHICQGRSKEILDIGYEDISCDDSFRVQNNQIHIDLQKAYQGSVILYIRKDNWMQSLKLTHRVSLETALPTAKLQTGTLKLSNVFRNQTAGTAVLLSQSNIAITGFGDDDTFVTTAKAGTAAEEEASKILVAYENGQVIARIRKGEIPKAGTYTYTATPYVTDVTGKKLALMPIIVKVNVSATSPKVRLGAATVKLNACLANSETAEIPVTVTDTTGYGAYVHSFEGLDAHDNILLRYENGTLQATLLEDTTGKYPYVLTPILRDNAGSEIRLNDLKLTVQSYQGKQLSVSLTSKGKMDILDPDSRIQYTVSKITNALGPIEAVELVQGGELFEISELTTDDKGKQTFFIGMREDAVYEIGKSYTLQLEYQLWGASVPSSVLKVKVTQSAIKLSAPNTSYYLSQSRPLEGEVVITSPAQATMAKIELNENKTSRELLEAMAPWESVTVEALRSETLRLAIQNPNSLIAGKSYRLVLDVTPTGNAVELKTTQVTLTVKVYR